MGRSRALDLLGNTPESEVLKELVESGDEFQQLVDENVIPLASEGQRSQAFRVLGQEGTPLIDNIEQLG